MQRLLSILAGIALLYVVYILFFKSWDYASEAKRQQQKELIKSQGLSTRYYFVSSVWVLLLNLLSGGGFFFYWLYKQWQAVRSGFKQNGGHPLPYAPWVRTLFFVFSFYQFNALLNRTCVYMHKHPAFPPWLWGTLLWAAPLAAGMPFLPRPWRIAGAVLFLLIPVIFQRRINTLPKDRIPFRIRIPEILWLLFCWVLWLAGATLYKQLH